MAKQKIIWSARAKLELLEILDFYFKRNGTKTYSIKLNANFRNAVRLIAKYPRLGFQSDIPNTRVLIEGNYAIFYEIKTEVIEISSIWDCRQNQDNNFLSH
ncbi:type II toxin-antitoxin system RelE/ParE family toxin [Roseimarinus sediminis]|uniref:type II toxin-antitoxin system RelE/ParE family toxin n=1 Tax=Roseimarinus sediminis TaxID=1610899 RepID=UPI003D1E6CB1